VLWEETTHEGRLLGWTDNYLRVEHPFDPLLPGEITLARLEQLLPNGNLQADAQYLVETHDHAVTQHTLQLQPTA
jgi:threonylcarbamoyladenosine tRNA methylthiotransferase MtaB